MDDLNQIADEYFKQLDEIKTLGSLGDEIVDIMLNLLNGFYRNNVTSLAGFAPENFQRLRDEITKLKGHKLLKEKYRSIYAQSLVLVVSSFESFMNDLFKFVVINHPHLINWPEKKNISIDVASLNYLPTVGDLVLKSFRDVINFQNAQSTMRFCNDYLGLKMSFEKLEDVHFFENLRHIIVHNGSRVDANFLNATRESKKTVPSRDAHYEVTEVEYLEADNVFRNFYAAIVDKLQDRINNNPIK